MPITPNNIVRHELIGLKAKVVRAKNAQNIGIQGKVVNETNKTLVIESKGKARAEGVSAGPRKIKDFAREKRIFKSQTKLQITLPSKKVVEVDGKLLAGRPWDRLKKKLKKW